VAGTLLAIDPGVIRTGWAALDPASGQCRAWGVLRPPGALDRDIRIAWLCYSLQEILAMQQPQDVVIEWTSGHVAGRHGGGGAGLATYGVAVGALWATAWHWTIAMNRESGDPLRARCLVVEENTWTRGRPKSERQRDVALLLRERYSAAADSGGDAADAIGLGWWVVERRRLRLDI